MIWGYPYFWKHLYVVFHGFHLPGTLKLTASKFAPENGPKRPKRKWESIPLPSIFRGENVSFRDVLECFGHLKKNLVEITGNPPVEHLGDLQDHGGVRKSRIFESSNVQLPRCLFNCPLWYSISWCFFQNYCMKCPAFCLRHSDKVYLSNNVNLGILCVCHHMTDILWTPYVTSPERFGGAALFRGLETRQFHSSKSHHGIHTNPTLPETNSIFAHENGWQRNTTIVSFWGDGV